MVTRDSDQSGKKVCVSPPDKPPCYPRKRILERVVDRDLGINYGFRTNCNTEVCGLFH